MTKVVLVLHFGPTNRAERRIKLVDELAPELLALGAEKLSMLIADEAADVPGPNPFVRTGLPVALVNLWLASMDPLPEVIHRVRAAGFDVAGYEVEESIPTDYGDNGHSQPRDWPDGVRSRGVTAVSLIERPPKLHRDEWIRRWHEWVSPVSARIQPRTRYVRNLVQRPVTPEAPRWDGIVEESWPSPRYVSNPFLFYGAKNPCMLMKHSTEIFLVVSYFTRIWRVRTFMASEWFIRT